MNGEITTKHDMQALENAMIEDLTRFTQDNPEILEALSIMNMTLPDYLEAIENMHGAQTMAVSAYTPLPLQAIA